MNSISWIDSFLPTERYFCRVDQEFIALHGGEFEKVKHFRNFQRSLECLFRTKTENQNEPEEILMDAKIIYGLVHGKFLMTEKGQEKMLEKYKNGDFGVCPRLFCKNFECFPWGQVYEYGKERAKLFCPNCTEGYADSCISHLDSAFFGPHWIHFLLNRHPEIFPQTPPEQYIPKIYGFRVYNPNHPVTQQQSESK